MSKVLVLAEKPSVGKDIGKALGIHGGKDGFMEGKDYVITWAMGHLVTLAAPEEYRPEYKEWKMELLPMLPEKMKLSVIGRSAKQYSTVKHLMNRSDIREIVIATDAGREGELVARWIIYKAGVRKPMKRLWISSVTEKAIKDGFRNLKDANNYENLYKSAEARSKADWIVGINATRALTVKHNAQLSLGRVQTPTLGIVKTREEEIRSFNPVSYHTIKVKAGGVYFHHEGGRIFKEEEARKKHKSLEGKKLLITDVKTVEKRKDAPLLYDLTELQRDASNLYGLSPKETLNTMQALYERHKVLTYPRTDSRYLTKDMTATLADRVKASAKGDLTNIGREILRKGIKEKKSFVNDQKVSDHHAIIPTEESVVLSTLTDKERKIYLLVVKRFLSVLMDPYVYKEMVVTGTIGEEIFRNKSKVTVSQGYRALLKEQDEEEIEERESLFKKGDQLSLEKTYLEEGKTKPPAYFTDATLLSAMENPVKYMESDDKKLEAILKETSGLGTVATRADIIEKLFSSFVLEKRGKEIHITEKGRQLLDLAPEELTSPEMTARWESKLEKIKNGQLKEEAFIREMEEYTKKIITEIKTSKKTFRHDNMTGQKCPTCGKNLLEVKGKKSTMLVCQDRECGFRKTLSSQSNARCPECKKKMELVGEGEGKYFKCKCGYREKLTAFQARREKEGTAMRKGEVKQYLSKINKENDEPLNSALSDALKDLFK
ncbi:DNA topoisomerase III [Proteiniclasticum sp. C24MP]|uniref:DNA topoisomerase III n=1 Tax=Proteiniclasticum sp. C24MP TaxID=3374101 RepID=UPI003755121C